MKSFKCVFSQEGINYYFPDFIMPSCFDEAFSSTIRPCKNTEKAYNCILRLLEAGICDIGKDSFFVSWDNVYKISEDSFFEGVSWFLEFPEKFPVIPSLNCKKSLSDKDFNVFIDSFVWHEKKIQSTKWEGAVVYFNKDKVLMPYKSWELVKKLAQQKNERTQHENEVFWGSIRPVADCVNAVYSSKYLQSTFVLTPEILKFKINKTTVLNERVVTLEPTFDGAPKEWIQRFDKLTEVKPHYDFSSGGTNCRVVIPDEVRKVLQVVKKDMPSRTVAGNKAVAFLHNPYAILGEGSHTIIKEEDFSSAKEEAGFFESVFELCPHFNNETIEGVKVNISTCVSADEVVSSFEFINTIDIFYDFMMRFKKACEANLILFGWKDYDFQVDARSNEKLRLGLQILYEWSNQGAAFIQIKDIYDLSFFGPRVEGIGVCPQIKIPYISQTSDSDGTGWIPDFIESSIRVGDHLIPLKADWLKEFEAKIAKAVSENRSEIIDSVLPSPVSVDQAKEIVSTFHKLKDAAFPIRETKKKDEEKNRAKKETLIIKNNFDSAEYFEERKQNLLFVFNETLKTRPKSMRDGISLLDHQEFGVQWLHHLYLKTPDYCRGALIADDMGLGKTLQILTLLAIAYENGETKPSLIIAPVALLDNWLAESKKFFDHKFPEILCLYGENLKNAKQPKAYIERALIEEKGITNLLKPNWMGSAKIILTTYETLRDYEFSLARELFAVMVCDEAQKIKTPNAMMTLAAKKMQVQFKVACTGTPVENSLVDLWCLFDFIQPGLLGALSAFSRKYRRPIEAKSDEQNAAIDELRELINPQILRRMKSDIAKDLPAKIIVKNNEETERLEVPISNYQKRLYADKICKLNEVSKEKDAQKRVRATFGVFHDLRAVCAEPYCLPGIRFSCDTDGVKAHLKNSAKMAWLYESLDAISKKGEKVLIFSEIREIQEALRFFINERYSFRPNVINGDSDKRQDIVDRFQEEDGFKVLILSPLAAGFGLNIVKANHVIHFTRTWNPAKEAQATDRAYRIGSKKDVFIYCPTIVDPSFVTFEVKLDNLMRTKSALASDMLNGAGGEFTIQDLTPDDVTGKKMPDRLIDMKDIDLLKPDMFEKFCAYLWQKQGYNATVTNKKGGDSGVDVIAFSPKGNEGVLLQSKTTTAEKSLPWDAVKDVVGGEPRYTKLHPGTFFKKAIITNMYFNDNAKEHAQLHNVEIYERDFIEDFLKNNPLMKSVLDDLIVGLL